MKRGRQEKVRFDVMSEKRCKCGKAIKQNVAMRKTTEDIECYKCNAMGEAGRGHFIGKYGKPRKKRIEGGLPVKEGLRIG